MWGVSFWYLFSSPGTVRVEYEALPINLEWWVFSSLKSELGHPLNQIYL